MIIDHTVTVQVQFPTSTSASSSSGSSEITNSGFSSKSCIGLNINSEFGCVFTLTCIFLIVLVDLIGAGFLTYYCFCLKKWLLSKRLLEELKSCPPVGDEGECVIVENEICIGEQIT